MLYVVATPIGNLDDISSRARSILESVSVVAAEDTRHTRHLLQHLGLATPTVSLHEHNEAERSRELLGRLAAGESVALVSDAGTPLVSDPGFRLVAGAREHGLAVTAIPGCCAAIAALSIAGLPASRFHFEGFLPARAAARSGRLKELKTCADTMIFYEAVHRIGETLEDLVQEFGARAPGLRRARADQAARNRVSRNPRGGSRGPVRRSRRQQGRIHDRRGGGRRIATRASADLERVVGILAAELPAGQAATLAARLTGAPRREAYRLALRLGERRGVVIAPPATIV